VKAEGRRPLLVDTTGDGDNTAAVGHTIHFGDMMWLWKHINSVNQTFSHICSIMSG
jgi:hypothetical protein